MIFYVSCVLSLGYLHYDIKFRRKIYTELKEIQQDIEL